MPDHSDGPLPDDIDVPTPDEAEPEYAAAVALYAAIIPRWAVMSGAGPED